MVTMTAATYTIPEHKHTRLVWGNITVIWCCSAHMNTFAGDIIQFEHQEYIIEKGNASCHQKLVPTVHDLQRQLNCCHDVTRLHTCLHSMSALTHMSTLTSAYQNFGLYAWYKNEIFWIDADSERTIRSFSMLSVPGFKIWTIEERNILFQIHTPMTGFNSTTIGDILTRLLRFNFR